MPNLYPIVVCGLRGHDETRDGLVGGRGVFEKIRLHARGKLSLIPA